jgi:hypothetical protein
VGGSRAFYIIQARWDQAVYKIGFSNGDSAARLRSYLHTYGRGNVTLHLLIRTAPNVTRERSAMYALETRVKRAFAAQIAALDRGAERLAVPIKRIRQALRLDRVEEGGRVMDLVDEVTAVIKNRSRRLRALRAGAHSPQVSGAAECLTAMCFLMYADRRSLPQMGHGPRSSLPLADMMGFRYSWYCSRRRAFRRGRLRSTHSRFCAARASGVIGMVGWSVGRRTGTSVP